MFAAYNLPSLAAFNKKQKAFQAELVRKKLLMERFFFSFF